MASQDVDTLQQRGKKLYRDAQYAEALDAFTKAITRCPMPKASLFDNRAATYERLGELQSALRDAQTTIRRHRKDITGYLRAGRVLQKMDDPEMALKIYSYGLGKVSISNSDDYKLLSSVHGKLSRQLSPPKAHDPFTLLPVEVAEMILHHLRFEQIVRCLRVSRPWNAFLVSRPYLWTHLDLSRAKRHVPISFVSHSLQRSKTRLTHATLHRLGDRDLKAMEMISRICRNLDTLEILSSASLGGSSTSLMSLNALTVKNLVIGKGAEVTLDTVCGILNSCTSLSKAEFEFVVSRGWQADWKIPLPNLRQLKMVGGQPQVLGASVLNMSTLMTRITNIETLTLNKWSMHTAFGFISFASLHKLKSLDLLDFRMAVTLDDLPPSLTVLRANNGGSVNPSLNTNTNGSPPLPLLTELQWSDTDHVHTFLRNIAGGRQLQKLTMNNSCYTAKELSKVLNSSRLGEELRELNLSHSDFDDDLTIFVTGKFPLLRRLDLSHTLITGVGIKTLVQGLKSLEYLAVNQCTNLSSDAVDWAAKQGIQVDHRSQDKLLSGRKVRLDY
ncbi:hypothetical protein EV356DRAFT_533366 [Viridothelium virens]|uniref:F-box domain-containing protein n=1 Tax=Viridothelium virens TaxID=1048519 RepID=A0A6A6H7A2_VIRVR|nr:hypothetical protein EV356DRAFT_533366 [Viridothelium virens]